MNVNIQYDLLWSCSQPDIDWEIKLIGPGFIINWTPLIWSWLQLWLVALREAVNNLTVTICIVILHFLSVSVSQTDGIESRSGSSLSLARVRPGTITNGTSKHSTSSSSSGAPSSSSGHKAQRSASTYHRQRRHSDFCKAIYWHQLEFSLFCDCLEFVRFVLRTLLLFRWSSSSRISTPKAES